MKHLASAALVLLITIPDAYSAEVRPRRPLLFHLLFFITADLTLSNPLFQTMMRGAPLFVEQAAIAATHEQTRQFVPQIEDAVDIHSLLESVTRWLLLQKPDHRPLGAAAPFKHEFSLCVVTNAGTRSAYAGIHSADVTACSNCLNEEGEKMQSTPPTVEQVCSHIDVCFTPPDPECPVECKMKLLKYINCYLQVESDGNSPAIICP